MFARARLQSAVCLYVGKSSVAVLPLKGLAETAQQRQLSSTAGQLRGVEGSNDELTPGLEVRQSKSATPSLSQSRHRGVYLRCGCLFTEPLLQPCTLYSSGLTQLQQQQHGTHRPPICPSATNSSIPKASESRLYQISGETKTHLLNFRLKTSRANKPQAVICKC